MPQETPDHAPIPGKARYSPMIVLCRCSPVSDTSALQKKINLSGEVRG